MAPYIFPWSFVFENNFAVNGKTQVRYWSISFYCLAGILTLKMTPFGFKSCTEIFPW